MKMAKKKSKARVVKAFDYERGKSNTKRDKARAALPPGRRISAKGNAYTETRKNRADIKGKKI